MRRWVPLTLAALLVAAVVAVGFRVRFARATPADLAGLIDRADKLVVRQEPWDESPVLFESSDRGDLDALKAALRVEIPEEYVHCMCDGTPAIALYAGGTRIGQITNHHARLIRCNLWRSDAKLLETEPLLAWFDARNIPRPRQEYEADEQRRAEGREHYRKWTEAMPSAVAPYWPTLMLENHRSPHDLGLAAVRQALAEDLPDKNVRIRALFAWYGSGAGPWSGFPSYEDIAEKMLRDYPTGELLAAIEGNELTEAETEGVARLFGGWGFSQRRPDDLRLLPAELKSRLLKHSLGSPNEDKRVRARRAFGTDTKSD